jgi:hypothetical protein
VVTELIEVLSAGVAGCSLRQVVTELIEVLSAGVVGYWLFVAG